MLSNPLAIKEDSYWPKSSALSQSGTVSALPATQKANGTIEYRVTHVQSCFFEGISTLTGLDDRRSLGSGLVPPRGKEERRKGAKAYFLSSGCNREPMLLRDLFGNSVTTERKTKKDLTCISNLFLYRLRHFNLANG